MVEAREACWNVLYKCKGLELVNQVRGAPDKGAPDKERRRVARVCCLAKGSPI